MTNPASGSVVGNSLVSFMSGMTPATRENVQLALLFAEKATTDVIREGSTIDPYTHYRNQLKYLGWDIQLPLERDDRAARRTVVESALAAIDVAGPGFRDSTQWAVNALHDNRAALFHFEQRSFESQTFRLIPCQSVSAYHVNLVLYQQGLAKEQLRSGFLSRERVVVEVRAELVRFDVGVFENDFKSRVLRSLRSGFEKRIIAL